MKSVTNGFGRDDNWHMHDNEFEFRDRPCCHERVLSETSGPKRKETQLVVGIFSF